VDIVQNIREQMQNRITERRWETETNGVDVILNNNRNILLATDAISQGKLTGLTLVSSLQPVNIQWKGKDGKFTQIDNSDVQVMAATMFNHVQKCFLREKELLLELENDDLSDITTISNKIEEFLV